MGMWSAPWQSDEKAEAFAKCMGAPWIAEVKKNEEGNTYGVSLEDIGGMFWDEDCLVGDDYLQDLLHEKADVEQKDFDIRECVKEALSDPLLEMENQPKVPKNLNAVNIVRKVLELPPISEDRELKTFQAQALKILKTIKPQITGPMRYNLATYPPSLKGIQRSMLGVPEGCDDVIVYCLSIETKEQKEFEIDLSSHSKVKRFHYERAGLFKVYYVE